MACHWRRVGGRELNTSHERGTNESVARVVDISADVSEGAPQNCVVEDGMIFDRLLLLCCVVDITLIKPPP